MKVKELIEKLKDIDGELDVMVSAPDLYEFHDLSTIQLFELEEVVLLC